MSLPGWPEDKSLGNTPCVTERQTWQCPNMLEKENDTDMTGENYLCKMCGKRIWLDYEEMR